jgi:hypothetical protein
LRTRVNDNSRELNDLAISGARPQLAFMAGTAKKHNQQATK